MTGCRLWVVVAALLASSAAATAQVPSAPPAPEQPGATFRSAVDVVSVAAVVRDRKGRFVPGLTQKDFVVLESGQPRPIVGFKAEEDGPVRVAILFDVSGSMKVGTKAADAREAARQVLGSLQGEDEAALFSFDTRLRKVKDFTSDVATLMSSLQQVDAPYGQTSLYDAIAETARAVAAKKDAQGRTAQRSAVVVLTDGIDTHSRLKPEEVSGIASGIDVPVYVMAVMSSIDDPSRFENPAAEAAGSLSDLARWTGGRLFTMSDLAQTTQAAQQIVGELRHQYLLAFEASPRPGWRSLEIAVPGRNVVVRARSGYFAGAASSMETSQKQ
jgi:Ca-activated chloride channel family protein